ALVAPALFNTVPEYPLAVVLACLLMPRPAGHSATARARQLDLAVPLGLGWLTFLLASVVARYDLDYKNAFGLAVGLPLLCSYFIYQFQRRPVRFALALGAVMLGSQLHARLNTHTLYTERNFFGVLRVARNERDTEHLLYNGSTLHGRQYTDLLRQCEPLSYYHHEGPLGQVFAAFQAQPATPEVSIVGLGSGATAAYARAGERWTFYEINPAVVGAARAPEYFTYLINCAHAPVSVVLGDARLQLQRAPDRAYGLIVLDAFSSDAIPVHLMTQQALDLYLAKLAPGGLLVYHISNRSLDLHPVVADLARSRALTCLVRDDTQAPQPAGKESSQWVVMARRPEDLKLIAADARWHTLTGDAGRHLWTDDFSNIISIFKWR
ncbi:MAG TPA: fused MFS/spermidine synthase, partial [Pyrinomonadaceae bacterium]